MLPESSDRLYLNQQSQSLIRMWSTNRPMLCVYALHSGCEVKDLPQQIVDDIWYNRFCEWSKCDCLMEKHVLWNVMGMI